MSYKQYDKNGNLVNPKDLQNKTMWCKAGERIESSFVRQYGERLNLEINPEKVQNPYAPDLLLNNKHLADLKTQNTPFFKVEQLYGLNPSYAVVFNRKDYERYQKEYPEIIIYFWVEWHSVKFEMGQFIQEVDYVNGVWSIYFQELTEIVPKAPEHHYRQRVNDRKGNARSSFVLDITNPSFKRVI